MCFSFKIYLLITLFSIQFFITTLTPIESSRDDDADCCLMGRKYAAIKQDFQHFIQLDQLNLDRRRKSTAVDQMVRQTNLIKFFSKIHLNHHFYTNSSICETNLRATNFRLPISLPEVNNKCQHEFTDCCLDEQMQFAAGIDLALRSRFKQNKISNDANLHSNMDQEVEYSISGGNEIRLNCNMLANKANKTPAEQLESIKNLSIGQSRAFDSCEACSVGIDSMDQFESCDMMDENRSRNVEQDELWTTIFKQCCRIIHLSKIAETQGLIKIKKN